jgi:hypothetical protein
MIENAFGMTGLNTLQPRLDQPELDQRNNQEQPAGGSSNPFYRTALSQALGRNSEKKQATPGSLEDLERKRQEQEKTERALAFEIRYFEQMMSAMGNNVYGTMSDAVHYGQRNRADWAASFAYKAIDMAKTGISISGAPDQIAHKVAAFNSLMLYNAHDNYSRVLLMKPSDYELLKLIGQDTQGRSEVEHRLAQITGRSSSTTPLSWILSELASLPASVSVPSTLQQLSQSQVQPVGGA